MKRRRPKPANFDYDFTGLAVEVTGDALYQINGGAEIANSIEAQANAQVGDTVTNSRGETHTLTQGDITWAQEKQAALKEQAFMDFLMRPFDASMIEHVPNPIKVDFSGFKTAQEALQSLGYKTERSTNPILTEKEINKIMQRNPKAYASSEELLAEWNHANCNASDKTNTSGMGFGFKSIDSAALYWAKTYGDDSIVTGHEYASAIFAYDSFFTQEDGSEKREARYFYNKPNEGYELNIFQKRSVVSWKQDYYTNGDGIENIRVVSAIHSHGDDLYGEFQSPSDTDKKNLSKLKQDREFSSHTGREYVVLPNGWVEEFGGEDDYKNFILSKDCADDIRARMSYSFIESDFGREIFNLYKNAYYHPDEFFPYSEN